LYPERQEDGRILKQLHLGFPVFYEGSEGDTIRLLKQNTVETVVQLSKGDINKGSLERKSVEKAGDTGDNQRLQ